VTAVALFETVLIANRGEIGCRIAQTLRRLGIRSVAVHAPADAGARHVRACDVAVELTGGDGVAPYLDIDQIVDVALRTGSQAVHPGYGFLAENARFAEACAEAGLVFVGPPPAAIDAMGDKIRAKQTVAAAGVPVVPGLSDRDLPDAELVEAALEQIGLPILIKPSAGGGGKGMRLVEEPDRLAEQMQIARREAANAFGDDALLLERFIDRPRHVEIQILADRHGNVVHLGERECSLQRRHQKIVEEAPSPLLSEAQRMAMGAQAVAAARACGYVNAGTIEFIVSGDRPDDFFFMEANTRLQVEHPVTELVWGLDLVEHQLRVAAGEALPFSQADLVPRGHAVEARVYAEDATHGFLPSTGRVLSARFPDGDDVRVDRGIDAGDLIGTQFDPMLAKIIANGPDRATALSTLTEALARTHILGVTTNVDFLRRLLTLPEVRAGDLDTDLVARNADALLPEDPPPLMLAAAALRATLDAADAEGPGPWELSDGWRLGPQAWARHRHLLTDGRIVESRIRRTAGGFELAVDEGEPMVVKVARSAHGLDAVVDRQHHDLVLATDEDSTWVGLGGTVTTLLDPPLIGPDGRPSSAHGTVTSPMPGQVVAVAVSAGDDVVEGQVLVSIEAMKMEHAILAPFDGTVAEVRSIGDQVQVGDVVVSVTPR
jgi:acetyl-CoA/propionyl-CoA carboxylase biotin carboxyl carrier protein